MKMLMGLLSMVLVVGTTGACDEEVRVKRSKDGDVTIVTKGKKPYVALRFIYGHLDKNSEGKERHFFFMSFIPSDYTVDHRVIVNSLEVFSHPKKSLRPPVSES